MRRYQPYRGSHCAKAFTLIEVLMVIAIISLLVAILLPALSAARSASKKVACQTNLRQLATAWHSYLDANDGHFLQGVNTHLNYGGQQGAGDVAFTGPKPLNTHVNLPVVVPDGAGVFRCPSDVGTPIAPQGCISYYGTSYMTNLMLIGQDQLPVSPSDPCKNVLRSINNRLQDLRRSRIGNEGTLALLGDFGWYAAQNRYDNSRIEWHVKPYTHNLAFMDGHVDFVRLRKGMYVTDQYKVIPFPDLVADALAEQREVATP